MTPQDALQLAQIATVTTPHGVVQHRHAGQAAAVTHVLLHGIGSASASWAYQLAAAAQSSTLKLLAWDAPGYGLSTPLTAAQPHATDYAQRLWDWLDALQVQTPVDLVGHSLGALMAARAARLQPARVRRVVLLSPARGYGDASAAERDKVLHGRLDNLQRLGPQGMAAARAAAMLTPDARADWVDAVRETMAQVNPPGYTQAVHLLVGGTLCDDVRALRCPIVVASGDADTITPPDACDSVAQAAGVSRVGLGPVGHACALQAADAVNALLGFPAVNP
jgi:pimeloyl-ACP methyl ester carboxylesterase